MKSEAKFLTRKEVAERLRVSKSTVERMEAAGELIGVVGFGNKRLYLESDVDKILDNICEQIYNRKKAAARLNSI
ncbi:helix-turn-helix domain-containing protein [uncultured Parasutterella sp.]|uniref:helix-turn-helix transcriptional regulator n=1 Tax=uncultured Parasutterella sp. TaxID=1263098 RepID=UPI00259646B4|nr:helix-turn-helix domain-containing protein [uncultured Parasutterella sp.]